MKEKLVPRIFISLLVAVIFGGITYFAVLAQPAEVPVAQNGDDCYRCHRDLYSSWHTSAHGQALEDEYFQERWSLQDQSEDCLVCHTTGFDPGTGAWESDGISCSNCHDPIPDDHPESLVPINRSSTLCESCHSDAIHEWKTSTHRQVGLTCVDCHSQHTATLKAADVGLLCVSCHHDIPETYSHIIHNDQNLSCPDCHLESLPGAAVEERGYSAKDHNFQPKITGCDDCHEYRLNEALSDSGAGTSLGVDYHDMLDEMAVAGISIEPEPVNPLSFAIVSAMVGLVVGLLLSPWIQERYRRFDFVITTSEKQEGDE